MNLRNAEKRIKLDWSVQATTMLAALSEDFPIEEFEAWVMGNKFGVGGSYLTEFLEIQEKKRRFEVALNKAKKALFPN